MDWSSTGYLALSALNVKNGYIDYSKDKYYGSDELYNKWMNGNNLYKGQVIFTTEAPMGNIVQIPDDNKYILSQRVIAFCVRNNVITDSFLALLLKSPFVFSQLISLSSGGTAQGISQKSLSSVTVYLPSNLIEQQKIADCLSSLDKLIEAHAQKLDALKQHKKGLMQRLFPAEDETMPRWRFPEFRNNGEWENIALGKLLTQSPDYGVNAPAVPYSSNLPTYIRITDISDNGKFIKEKRMSVNIEVTEKNYLHTGDIVLARTGASVGKSYKYQETDGSLVFAGFLIRISPDINKSNSEFINQFFHTQQYWNWVHFTSMRSGQPGINGTEYASLPVPIPSLPEQQKIADCLSSLDEQMESQEKKIAALKEHKKGMMQQLFPSL